MNGARRIILLTLVTLLAGALPGYAHMRTHVWVGPVWGPGLWWGPAYYPPPRTVVIERPPEIYVQPAPPLKGYWYYCRDEKAYYPYVKQCPGGWTKVSPAPPPQEAE